MAANDVKVHTLQERVIVFKGAGEMATGAAHRLHRSNFRRILMLEIPFPLAVRRRVSFCEAVHEQRMVVEGVEAVRITEITEMHAIWAAGKIAVLVDREGASICRCKPDVLIDATLAKRNLGLTTSAAPLVIAFGPGFTAGRDCHVVIETNRGHNLGRLITSGTAEADTGIPGNIGGYTTERVVRSPVGGHFESEKQIGDLVGTGEVVGRVGKREVIAQIDGVVRGLIRPGSLVSVGMKIGDIDPRGETRYCDTISEKARALGGSVLEAILSVYNQ